MRPERHHPVSSRDPGPARNGRIPRLLAILALLSPGILQAAGAEPGRWIVTNLASAPFPHSVRSQGHTYQGRRFPAEIHYADRSVLIGLPTGFQPGATVDVVVHFHGWNNNVTNALHEFRLLEQLQASHRPALLVMPEGPRNAPDSSGGKLEEPEGFRRLMADVLRVAAAELGRPVKLGQVTLSGHSGGYRVIGWILQHGGLEDEIREVFLFDAIYAQTEHFRAWAAKPGRRLIAIYTDGGGTLEATRRLMADLKADGVPWLAAEDAGLTGDMLTRHRILFLHTDLGHNDVLSARRHFERFLATRAATPPPAEAR